jgi:N utilization substance protein B
MSLPQVKFRELVFLILFRHSFSPDSADFEPSFYMHELKTTKKNVLEAKDFVDRMLEHLPQIDKIIDKVCVGYDLERIQSVEVNILRLCLYEMLFLKETPEKVLIAEGIRLAKKFSTEDSISFVNGLLDQVYKNKSDFLYIEES